MNRSGYKERIEAATMDFYRGKGAKKPTRRSAVPVVKGRRETLFDIDGYPPAGTRIGQDHPGIGND